MKQIFKIERGLNTMIVIEYSFRKTADGNKIEDFDFFDDTYDGFTAFRAIDSVLYLQKTKGIIYDYQVKMRKDC